jgi:CBS domain-containing protein
MQVRDIMNTEVVTIARGNTLAAAAALMLEHRINGLPVLDEQGSVVGMVGIRDVLRVPIPSHSDMLIIKWTRLDEKARELTRTTVEQVMAREVVSVREDATVIEVAALMANRGVHPIPVIRDGRLVGVIGRADVMRVLLALSDDDVPDNQTLARAEVLDELGNRVDHR